MERPSRQERRGEFRFNGVFGEGDGFVDGSHQKRELGDLGIDVQPWTNTVLELNFTDYRLTDLGYPGWFTYSEKIALPSAPDPKLHGLRSGISRALI